MVTFNFTKTALFAGKGEILIKGKNVARSEIKRTDAFFPWEGIDIGRHTKKPVTKSYAPPFPFKGHIEKVEYHN